MYTDSSEYYCETKKSLQICSHPVDYIIYKDPERKRTETTRQQQMGTANAPLCVTRSLNVLLAISVCIYGLALVLNVDIFQKCCNKDHVM